MNRAFAALMVGSTLAAFGCGVEAGGPSAQGSTIIPSKDPAAPPVAATPDFSGDGSSSSSAGDSKSGAPYPVVLMHGMSGFAKLNLGVTSLTYFDGVVEDLASRGESVFVTVVPPYDTSEERAAALAPQIDDILKRTGKDKVNLVGHSQGGMDARVLVSPNGLGYGDRVASVTTVASPHRGSKVADAILGATSGIPLNVLDAATNAVLDLLQVTIFDVQSDPHLQAQLTELSEKFMAQTFNPKYVDDARVAYTSYAGRTNLRSGNGVCDDGKFPNDPSVLDATQATLSATALLLEDGSGKVNDGLVTVTSAKWGTFLQCVPADHLKEIGMLGPAANSFDHIGFFRDVVARVRSAGF